MVIGAAYAALFVVGILSASVGVLGGLLPLNRADDVLHVVTALAALGLYFTARMPEAQRGTA